MSLRVIIYSLKSRESDGKTILSYDLNGEGILVGNNLEHVELKLNGKIYTVSKALYMNRKIYDFGSGFLFMANKQVKSEYVFDLLMEYAISKLKTRAIHIDTTLQKFTKELNVHRKQLAA